MDFFEHHGLIFLICITLFPRLTILFATSLSWGLFGILGFIFTPHLLVAILATTYYWHTNPILCIIAWIVALGGTSGEGAVVNNQIKR